MDYINQIICGDCIEVMKGFPDNSIDTIITDPPYGLSFMGKKWDYNVPSVEVWQECLRVLKPGGTALIFAGGRTQHRMACNVEDAGFILKDCIMWLYGSGFPKATDISKQIDKTLGTYIEGKETLNSRCGIKGDKSNYNHSKKITENNPQSPEATLWDGWKSHGLKPAYEPILVAMKPNEGSYANNALKWGVAGINADGGRIPYEEGGTIASNPLLRKNRGAKIMCGNDNNGTSYKIKPYPMKMNITSQGRFPANIILDEEAARLLDEQSGVLNSHGGGTTRTRGIAFSPVNKQRRKPYPVPKGDSGGASRFFYCAKASKAERNRGCEGLEETRHADRNKIDGIGGNVPNNRINTLKKNHHPTVKPLALMKYLVTLTKMPNPDQIYLDPFCGSGTTLMACKELKRKYIGIDSTKEYVEIAKCRVRAIPELLF